MDLSFAENMTARSEVGVIRALFGGISGVKS
jgi:hypothetical protein